MSSREEVGGSRSGYPMQVKFRVRRWWKHFPPAPPFSLSNFWCIVSFVLEVLVVVVVVIVVLVVIVVVVDMVVVVLIVLMVVAVLVVVVMVMVKVVVVVVVVVLVVVEVVVVGVLIVSPRGPGRHRMAPVPKAQNGSKSP